MTELRNKYALEVQKVGAKAILMESMCKGPVAWKGMENSRDGAKASAA